MEPGGPGLIGEQFWRQGRAPRASNALKGVIRIITPRTRENRCGVPATGAASIGTADRALGSDGKPGERFHYGFDGKAATWAQARATDAGAGLGGRRTGRTGLGADPGMGERGALIMRADGASSRCREPAGRPAYNPAEPELRRRMRRSPLVGAEPHRESRQRSRKPSSAPAAPPASASPCPLGVVQPSVVACPNARTGAGDRARDHGMKAAFPYEFGASIRWPKSPALAMPRRFIFGVTAMRSRLRLWPEPLRYKAMHGSPRSVRREWRPAVADTAAVLRAGGGESSRRKTALLRLPGTPALTVDHSAAFARRGNMIALDFEARRRRVAIKLPAMQAGGDKPESEPFPLARIVESEAEGMP